MFRLAPLLITATAIHEGDETSLMQGVKQPLAAKEDKSKSVSSLLETAKSMLKNGATPDVVTFAEATLESIFNGDDGVMSRIQDAHNADVRLVEQTFLMFGEAFAELQAGNHHIFELYTAQMEHHANHQSCRGEVETPRPGDCDTEYCKCENKRDCDYELFKTWSHFSWEEADLRFKSGEIKDHFCVEDPAPANGSTWVFRDYSVAKFPHWIEQKGVVEEWFEAYNTKQGECVQHDTQLDQTTDTCDGHQEHLESATCTLANTQREVQNAFARFWVYATRTYQSVVDDVHCLEIDRWKEYKALKTVECLLGRTRERNGRPCEEVSDEFQHEAAACESVEIDLTSLIVPWPTPPQKPDDCEFSGCSSDEECICIPVPVPIPCATADDYNQGWWNDFYGELFQPPTPTFHQPDYRVDNHLEPVNQAQHHERCMGEEGVAWARIDDQCWDLSLRETLSHSTRAVCTCPEAEETGHWDALQTLRDTGNSHCNPRPPCRFCTLEPEVTECELIRTFVRDWIRTPGPDDSCHEATPTQLEEGSFDPDNGFVNPYTRHQVD